MDLLLCAAIGAVWRAGWGSGDGRRVDCLFHGRVGRGGPCAREWPRLASERPQSCRGEWRSLLKRPSWRPRDGRLGALAVARRPHGARRSRVWLVLGKAAKSHAAAGARGLVMGVVIVVRATIRYNYLRFVDILDTPPTRSSNQPPAAVP